MAEDSSRASSPEPGEAPGPRSRIIQLKGPSTSASRGSMDRQLEARPSGSPSSSQSQWRSSPPRGRFGRSHSGRGYFKRHQTGFDGGGPYQRERVFSRARGRSVSRSPSRASQRTRSRSRSHSPRSPKSPQRSRPRSRSRSFSPRGHRTFANWERDGRGGGRGQYIPGRGGRGTFDMRQRGRDRDPWPRSGGRGGGRYTSSHYQRSSRFYPKDMRYKQAAPMPHRRSISRDRSSESGTPLASSFRDRQIREREQREYELAFRGRPREREATRRTLARSTSYSSDYQRDPSASAEEGEEKPEENQTTMSEKSAETHTPSEAGSTDRDNTGATSSGALPAETVTDDPSHVDVGEDDSESKRDAKPPTAKSDVDVGKVECTPDAISNSAESDSQRVLSTSEHAAEMEVDVQDTKEAGEIESSQVFADVNATEPASEKSVSGDSTQQKHLSDVDTVKGSLTQAAQDMPDAVNDTKGVVVVKENRDESGDVPEHTSGEENKAAATSVGLPKASEKAVSRAMDSESLTTKDYSVCIGGLSIVATDGAVGCQETTPTTVPAQKEHDENTSPHLSKSPDEKKSSSDLAPMAVTEKELAADSRDEFVTANADGDQQRTLPSTEDVEMADVGASESGTTSANLLTLADIKTDIAKSTSAGTSKKGDDDLSGENDVEEGEMVGPPVPKENLVPVTTTTRVDKLDKESVSPERTQPELEFVQKERLQGSPVLASKDSMKLRSTSFTFPSVSNESSREDGKQPVKLATTQKNSPQCSRPALDRRASFSTFPGRGGHATIGDARQTSGGSTAGLNLNPEDRKKGPLSQLRRENVGKRELLRAGSVDSMMDRSTRPFPKLFKESSSASNSPSRRTRREEQPALPNIPLPSSSTRDHSSPSVAGDGTPTKRQRPRLGWGQGLVAASPPQPVKRPRIGWGEGLVQQSKDSNEEKNSVAAAKKDTSLDASDVNVPKTGESNVTNPVSPDKQTSEVKPKELESNHGENNGCSQPEPTKEKTESASEKDVHESSKVTDKVAEKPETDATGASHLTTGGHIALVETAESDKVPEKPSKEEILSTIDSLDSDIADVKKQMKSLQKSLADRTVEPKAASKSSPMDIDPTCEDKLLSGFVSNGDTKSTEDAVNEPPTSPSNSSQGNAGRLLVTSPVKVAVDSRFVELLADVFSENLRKSTAANDQLPKRFEQGRLATKIYHQPSNYAFYQSNIDRGEALADRVRSKVRERNRSRHEYMKRLARDYVELKKSWKLRVKKMEKDRKRQDKMRLKQLHKLKLKSLSENGPMRTTNTNHQSPHVQQLVAAEKAAEGDGTMVRTSSRLTNNSSGDLDNNDLEKIEQAKAQALIDQEVRRKRLKNALSTVIPDMLITPAEREQRYFTRFPNGQSCMADGLVTDWKQKEKAEMKVNPWNDLEKCIFIDKFLQFPKNFPRISSFLRNKTTGDVIAFYYLTKKVADYKALLREQQLRRRGAGSKNTWSCWNLTACAAISLGVRFPEHVAKLLLHPSNFRSHQASDNILNSAGAQRLLKNSTAKTEQGSASESTKTGDASPGKRSALDMVSGSDHTPTVRLSLSENGVDLDDVISGAESDTSDEEKFNLYTQQLEQFIAGQQQPFLMDYASFLTDNSYSTGYEVSTLSIEERLKRYPVPSKELESSMNTAPSSEVSGTAMLSQGPKGKAQGVALGGSGGSSKNGGAHLTKKELKQQRKLKKLQEEAAAVMGLDLSLSGEMSSQITVGDKPGRKKSAVATPNSLSGNRNTPRIAIPDEKAASGGKKANRAGGSTPASRRNSHQAQTNITSAAGVALSPAASASSGVLLAATGGAAPKKVSGGNVTPNANVRVPSPGGNAAAGSNVAAAGAPAKRVVQKWTEAEKADFLKYFSQYGKDWATLTENIPTKTAAQIKNYYQNYKNRLNLQDILKRRIENAGATGGAKGAGAAGASPRSAAAGLMSGTLRQMPPGVELSTGMPAGASMAMGAGDSMSFQAALNAAQPGMQALSELPPNQFGMQSQQDPQQPREMMNPAANSERYLKLLNMQHQLQIMQFQQQQKSQVMTSEGAAAGNNVNAYHDGQMNAANAQRLFQFSRQQAAQQQVPPQHLPLQALQQMGLHGQSQVPAHSQMMQIPIQQQQQQQGQGAYADMGRSNNVYHSMTQMQHQPAAPMNMSPTSAAQYVDPSKNSSNSGTAPGMMAHRDISQRTMLNMALMNKVTGGTAPEGQQHPAAANSPGRPPMGPPRSMMMETNRPPELESRQHVWHSAAMPTSSPSALTVNVDVTTSSAAPSVVQSNSPKGREALAPPAPPPVQAVRSRMSFSSILNESESPREDGTPRGNGSMVIKEEESPCTSQQQQQRDSHEQQQQLRIDHVRAAPPSSAAEMSRSPVSAPSPTAHLLPRRVSTSATPNRMGLMSSLLNVSSPEHRAPNPGHQSPLVQQQQQQQHQQQMQAARYYNASTSSTDNGPPHSRGPTMVSSVPTSTVMSAPMARASPSEKMSNTSGIGGYSSASAQMQVALSRSASGSSTSSAISANATSSASSHGQQQMWNYAPQMRYEEAELLRRAQRAEEEAARAAAAAAAAARALQEAQQARQEALNMAASMARYNSAMQQQQTQQQQQQQQQAQQQAQYQQLQQYQQQQMQVQQHHQQMQQQQQHHEYHQQHQAQQLHQQQMQHQALHHHLQMMQQQQQQQQQPPRGPQSDR